MEYIIEDNKVYNYQKTEMSKEIIENELKKIPRTKRSFDKLSSKSKSRNRKDTEYINSIDW